MGGGPELGVRVVTGGERESVGRGDHQQPAVLVAHGHPLQPAVAAVLLGHHEVHVLVRDRRGPATSAHRRVAVRVRLVRAVAHPLQVLPATGQLQLDAHAGQVGELLGDGQHDVEPGPAVGPCHGAVADGQRGRVTGGPQLAGGRGHDVLAGPAAAGRCMDPVGTVQSQRVDPAQRLALDTAQPAHTQAVVVGLGPEHRRRPRGLVEGPLPRRQHAPRRRHRDRAAHGAHRHVQLVPPHERTLGEPLRGGPLVPLDCERGRGAGRAGRSRPRRVDGQVDHPGLLRTEFGHVERAGGHGRTVDLQHPAGPQVGQVGEPAVVGHPHAALGGVDGGDLGRAAQPADLGQLGVGHAVGGHQAVAHEVGVVRRVAEVAAVAPDWAARRTGAAVERDAVLEPLPDEPALEPGGLAHGPAVVGERARRVAHGVRVLAEDHRPPGVVALGGPGHGVGNGRVHGAHHVGDRGLGVQVVHERALVVEGTGRVGAAHPRGGGVVGRAVAGLVAEGPHHDAGVRGVALDHAAHPLLDHAVEPGVEAQRRLPGMGLDVGLVDQVEPQLVAELGQVLVVRVVRGPDGVEVVGLHEQQVEPGLLAGDGPAQTGVVLVQVHAVDLDRPAVDQQRLVAHLDRAEPGPAGTGLDHCAGRVAQLDREPVALGHLVRPRDDARDVELRPSPAGLGEHPVDRGDGRVGTVPHPERQAAGGGEPAATGGGDGHLDGPAVLPAGGSVDLHVHVERARAQVVAQARHEPGGGQVRAGGGVHGDAALDAAVPPLVLVLDPRAARPLHDGHGDRGAPAGAHVGGDVELGRQAAVGGHAHELAVDPHVRRRLRRAEAQHDATTRPVPRHGERRPVGAGGVLLGDGRRFAVERHLHVRVVRQVEPRRAVLVLEGLGGPRPGHLDLLPARVVERRGLEPGGHQVGPVGQVELPGAVEGAPPRRRCGVVRVGGGRGRERHQRGGHRQAADGGHLRVGPGPGSVVEHRGTLGQPGVRGPRSGPATQEVRARRRRAGRGRRRPAPADRRGPSAAASTRAGCPSGGWGRTAPRGGPGSPSTGC